MKRWYVSDVMTRDVVTVSGGTGYKDIADLMVRHAVSAVAGAETLSVQVKQHFHTRG